mmetsp:Transcript_55240/g.157233  ORF Transcript_55240/g.157233 Transcript_55240/m.157233 type:complete len:535 (+) Transcript_55240:872-2476(+)
MTGLLDQGATGVLVETVPIVHLDQEREPVLPDGHRVQPSQAAAVCLADELLDRWHPAVLHARHEDAPHGGMLLEQPLHLLAVPDGRAQRLLAQDVLACRDRQAQHLDVLEVGRAHDDCVYLFAGEQVCVVLEHLAPAGQHAKLLQRLQPGLLAGVGDGGDDRRVLAQQLDVANVLLAHGARADDPNAHGCRRRLHRGLHRRLGERQPAEGREHAPRRREGVARVHHQGVVYEENVALVPLEGHAPLLHELGDPAHRLRVHGRAVAKHDRLLAHVPRVVPSREGGDHGVEEDTLPGAPIHAERRQDGRRCPAVAVGQPLVLRALPTHGLLGLLARGHVVRLLPRAALCRGGVRHLWHHSDVAHTQRRHLAGELWVGCFEELCNLLRVDNRCSTALRRGGLAVEEDVRRRLWRLRQLMVERDRLVWRRLVRGEDQAGHELRPRRRAADVVIALAVHRARHRGKILGTANSAAPEEHCAVSHRQLPQLGGVSLRPLAKLARSHGRPCARRERERENTAPIVQLLLLRNAYLGQSVEE